MSAGWMVELELRGWRDGYVDVDGEMDDGTGVCGLEEG